MSKTETPDIVERQDDLMITRPTWSEILQLYPEQRDEIERLRAALAKYQWRTMESAPRDAAVLLNVPGHTRAQIGRWDDDKYARKPKPFWNYTPFRVSQSREAVPTHWLPLPEPPSEETK